MLIVSQNKDTIINLDNIQQIKAKSSSIVLYDWKGNEILLGLYPIDNTKKILNEIVKARASLKTIFEMP